MRLIDADALIDRLDYCVKEGMGSTIAFTFKHMVDDAPTIEPKRGKWVDTDKKYCGSTVYACSECKSEIDEMPTFYEKPMYKWCPYCGADMRGKDDEASD